MSNFKGERRCYHEGFYIKHLSALVNQSKHKEKLSTEDKIAKVLLFNLEHYRRYEDEMKYTYSLMVLDHYSYLEPDEDDIFHREKFILKVPAKVRKVLFEEYKKEMESLKLILENGVNEDGTLKLNKEDFQENNEELPQEEKLEEQDPMVLEDDEEPEDEQDL